MAVSYYLLLRKSLTRWVGLSIIFLIAVDAVLHTMIGSRSALVEIIKNYIIVILAIAGRITFSRKISITVAALLPIIIVLLIGSFTFASFVRANRGGDDANFFDTERLVELYKSSELQLSNFEKILPPIFDRIGFFDYSAEIIAHRDTYTSVINVESYAKSIVDNLLTPGFDIFDQPKISNSLKFIYQYLGTPSKLAVTDSYQSDQLGLYGELYALFGYVSLPLFFLLAYLLKRIYLGLRSENPFNLAMKRIVVLYLFVTIINSYGIDWFIIDILIFAFTIYAYKFLFQIKPDSALSSFQVAKNLAQ